MVDEFYRNIIISVRCVSASSLSDKENQDDQPTPFTLCSSISRVPLSTMENHCVGVTTPTSDVTTTKRPAKRSYADAVQSSRAKRTNSILSCTPTSDDAFSPSSSSCPSDLSEVYDEFTPEADEKYDLLLMCLCYVCVCVCVCVLRCEGACTVPAQRRLSFTAQRRYCVIYYDTLLILLP